MFPVCVKFFFYDKNYPKKLKPEGLSRLRVFNPNYALAIHSLPSGLTKTLETNVLSRLNPGNENHQLGFLTLG